MPLSYAQFSAYRCFAWRTHMDHVSVYTIIPHKLTFWKGNGIICKEQIVFCFNVFSFADQTSLTEVQLHVQAQQWHWFYFLRIRRGQVWRGIQGIQDTQVYKTGLFLTVSHLQKGSVPLCMNYESEFKTDVLVDTCFYYLVFLKKTLFF